MTKLTDNIFRDTLTAFDVKKTRVQGLPAVPERKGLPANVGVGQPIGAVAAGTSSSLGNLTEKATTKVLDTNGAVTSETSSRTYFASEPVLSSDGIFTFYRKPLKTLTMVSVDKKEITFTFNNK